MYKVPVMRPGSIKRNTSTAGETIEQKIERIISNKEPIKDGAPLIYTERKEGVKPAYNVRTDRFVIAVEAMDKVQGMHQAKREERAKLASKEDGGAEPIQGKGDNAPTGGDPK